MSGDDMEHRVSALEKSVGRIDVVLDKLLEELRQFRMDAMVKFARIEEKLESKASASELARIEEKLESKASASEFAKIEEKLGSMASASELAKVEEKLGSTASASELAEVKGRIASLPTTLQMITLVFGILGGAFLILKFGLPHGP